jgi:hypothetical protein
LLLAGALVPLAAGAQPAPLKGAAGQPPEVRRAFVVDGAEVLLPPPNGLSDEELTDFLRAIKRGAIVWTDTKLAPRVIRLADVDFVGASGPPRLYHIFVRSPASPNTTYVYAAEFDGTTITISRASQLKR